jgi:uncharacterized membrane protein
MEMIKESGLFGWLLLINGIILIGAIIYFIIKAFGRNKNEKKHDINLIIYLGLLAFAIGMLGTTTGFYFAAGAISQASEISMSVIWAGVRSALSSLMLGLEFFTIALISWLLFRSRLKQL